MSLNTKCFIDLLISHNYTHLCVVPCSFAKHVINEAINNSGIEYLPAASEAVACSIAAGLKMSGKKPIVIVQSSGLTNMASCITSLLKPYGITFPILSSWRTYKEGDSEIQHQHLATELPKLIDAYGYKYHILDSQNLDKAVSQVNNCNNTHTICIIKKDSFDKAELNIEHQLNLSSYTPRSVFLRAINTRFRNASTLFIGTTGNTAANGVCYLGYLEPGNYQVGYYIRQYNAGYCYVIVRGYTTGYLSGSYSNYVYQSNYHFSGSFDDFASGGTSFTTNSTYPYVILDVETHNDNQYFNRAYVLRKGNSYGSSYNANPYVKRV